MKTHQTSFPFCRETPPLRVLEMVREVKISTVRESIATIPGLTDRPEVAVTFWRNHVANAPWFDPMKEHLVVLLLDTKYRCRDYSLVSIGSLNESIAHPREVLRPAIVSAAYAFVLMHNHPSGNPAPSQADHSLTRRIAEASELVQVKLLDHVIVGEEGFPDSPHGYFSFKEAGVL